MNVCLFSIYAVYEISGDSGEKKKRLNLGSNVTSKEAANIYPIMTLLALNTIYIMILLALNTIQISVVAEMLGLRYKLLRGFH